VAGATAPWLVAAGSQTAPSKIDGWFGGFGWTGCRSWPGCMGLVGPDAAVGLGASYTSNAPRCIIYI
jgi:hypothetical protein